MAVLLSITWLIAMLLVTCFDLYSAMVREDILIQHGELLSLTPTFGHKEDKEVVNKIMARLREKT
jgi:hypothetical protein